MNEPRTRNIFPTVRSILNADALAEAVRARYALEVTNCELLKPRLSDLYRVDTTQGPYILRVYPQGLNLGKWIEAELGILRYLDARGLPVSTPIPLAPLAEDDGTGPSGEYLLPLDAPEGERNAVLFEYAHGRALKRSRNLEDFFLFGKLVARMHHAGAGMAPQEAAPQEAAADGIPADGIPAAGIPAAGIPAHGIPASHHNMAHALSARVPLDAYTLLVRPLELLGAAYPERTADVDALREAADVVGSAIERLRRHPAAWGFCHGNLNFSNAHLDARGSFTLFDFEYCGPGWPIYDLATVHNFESRETVRPFMEGYESERPLLDAERAALGWFQAANQIWMLGHAASLTCVFGSQIVTGAYFDQVLESIREKLEGAGR